MHAQYFLAADPSPTLGPTSGWSPKHGARANNSDAYRHTPPKSVAESIALEVEEANMRLPDPEHVTICTLAGLLIRSKLGLPLLPLTTLNRAVRTVKKR